MKQYDYIIAGAGCAGLSLIMRMIRSGKYSDKKILLTDRAPKTTNDHTWCFWEKKPGFFEPVVCRSWHQLHFHSETFSSLLQISPYRYKMIRAIDFYQHCFALIEKQDNISIKYGEVEAIGTDDDKAFLSVSGERMEASFIFSSLPTDDVHKQPDKHYLLQHFKGWTIETDKTVFDPEAAILMDFREGGQDGNGFIYLLPFSATKAMIEFTVFSENLLSEAEYDEQLKKYCDAKLSGYSYTITETERGSIPMTNHDFESFRGRVIYIGTAAGYTKPSTGYTFQFIQRHLDQLVAQQIRTGDPRISLPSGKQRFLFYDAVLLRILKEKKLSAAAIFSRLFEKNRAVDVFRFLDNETNILEECRLTLSLQKKTFVKAAMKEIRHKT